jgi:hypothetical protein
MNFQVHGDITYFSSFSDKKHFSSISCHHIFLSISNNHFLDFTLQSFALSNKKSCIVKFKSIGFGKLNFSYLLSSLNQTTKILLLHCGIQKSLESITLNL